MIDDHAKRRDQKRARRARQELTDFSPELSKLDLLYRKKYHKPQRGGVREIRASELSQDGGSGV